MWLFNSQSICIWLCDAMIHKFMISLLIPSIFALRIVFRLPIWWLAKWIIEWKVKLNEISQNSFYKFESLFTLSHPFAMLCFRFELFTINFDFTFSDINWTLGSTIPNISWSLVSISNDFYFVIKCVEVSKISIVVIQYPYAIGHSSECFCVTKNIIFLFYSLFCTWVIHYYLLLLLKKKNWINISESKKPFHHTYVCWKEFLLLHFYRRK